MPRRLITKAQLYWHVGVLRRAKQALPVKASQLVAAVACFERVAQEGDPAAKTVTLHDSIIAQGVLREIKTHGIYARAKRAELYLVCANGWGKGWGIKAFTQHFGRNAADALLTQIERHGLQISDFAEVIKSCVVTCRNLPEQTYDFAGLFLRDLTEALVVLPDGRFNQTGKINFDLIAAFQKVAESAPGVGAFKIFAQAKNRDFTVNNTHVLWQIIFHSTNRDVALKLFNEMIEEHSSGLGFNTFLDRFRTRLEAQSLPAEQNPQ